ncbi:MAG: hypothetical protein J5606_10220 [Bacteroidales bacterium]|nr:hypothetical protein [Bacteroidales bacterium]
MKTLKIICCILCLLFAGNNISLAQKKHKPFSGEITYKLSYNNLSEEMSTLQSILPSNINIYVKDSTILMNISVFDQSIKIIKNANDDNVILLFNMAGMTMATEISPNDSIALFNKLKAMSGQTKDTSVILKENSKTQKICGYTCQGYDMYKLDTNGKEQLFATQFICPDFLPWFYNGLVFYIETIGSEQQAMSFVAEITKITSKKLSDDIFAVPQNAIRMKLEDLLNSFTGNE